MYSVVKASVRPIDVWVIFFFFFFFSEFVGGLAIRKIDGRSCLCVFAPAWALLLSSLQPAHRDSPGAWQPPTLSSYQLPCSPRLTLPLTSPPPTHFCPSLLLSSTLFFPRTHIHLFFCPLFCPFHTRPSLLVFNLQPPHLLCGFSLSFVMLPSPTVHCLCLYGNPAWTGVAKRSVRHWYRP